MGSFLETPGGLMFADDPDGLMEHFSPSCLVTPQISGLWPASKKISPNTVPLPIAGNFPALQAMWDSGIRTVVGDNTRKELCSTTSKYHGVWTTKKEYGVDGILIIPRFAPSIPFNSHTPEAMMAEFNELKMCDWTPGKKCPKYPISFDDAIKRQAQATTAVLLAFRGDPYMFHQANMHVFKYKNQQASLTSAFATLSMEEYLRYITKLPVMSPKMEDIATFFRERMSRDECDISGTLKKVNGEVTEVIVKGKKTCSPILTINMAKNPLLKSQNSSSVFVELYGSDITYQLPLQSNDLTQKISFYDTKNLQKTPTNVVSEEENEDSLVIIEPPMLTTTSTLKESERWTVPVAQERISSDVNVNIPLVAGIVSSFTVLIIVFLLSCYCARKRRLEKKKKNMTFQ